MPVYRAPSAQVDELHLPTNPECIVWMKRRGTTGDRYDAEDYVIQAQAASTNGTPNGKAPAAVARSWVVAVWEMVTLALITDWNLEDEGGDKWPFSVESLRRLDPVDGAFLERETRRRMDGPDGPFGSTWAPPSSATTSTTPESGGSSPSTTGPEPEDGRLTSSGASS